MIKNWHLTHLIKNNDKHKSDPKLVEVIEDNEERKHNEIKLLGLEKLKFEHTKVEFELNKIRAETKCDNIRDFEEKESRISKFSH